jgi:uncharacterized membrane protein
MSTGTLAFVASLASSWFMCGLIWIVQVVHYPLFGRVGREGFAAYEAAHARLITPIVGPAMLVELVSSIALLAARPRGMPAWAAWAGVALVGVAWASTAFVQVPLHGTLARGFDEDAHARLVATNWVRTAAWSGHAALMAWCLALVLGGAPAEGRP